MSNIVVGTVAINKSPHTSSDENKNGQKKSVRRDGKPVIHVSNFGVEEEIKSSEHYSI